MINIAQQIKRITLVITALIILASCEASGSNRTSSYVDYGYKRCVDALKYSDIDYHPWDIKKAVDSAPVSEKKQDTLMIYMNGSDLESETGAASADLKELTCSGIDTSKLNIVIFTGGANRWENRSIPANECVLSQVADGKLTRLAGVGQRNMGDAGTLAAFIMYTKAAFPADNYYLILWDHGGGTIAGYGDDENFRGGNLTLRELEYAFSKAGLSDEKLEMIGFDACLMASVETAVICSDFAKFMTASESLEPQSGWDYSVIRKLGENPRLTGDRFGELIATAFIDSGGVIPLDEMTLSVIDLSKVNNVMGALGKLAVSLNETLSAGDGIRKLASARAGTRAFGDGTPENADIDMVDIYDMSRKLKSINDKGSAALRDTLKQAVIINKTSSGSDLGGLSCYYIYGSNTDSRAALEVYRELYMSGEYTAYLAAFAEKLYTEDFTRDPAKIMNATIEGTRVSLFETAKPKNGELLVTEAVVNGNRAELVIFFEHGVNTGKLLGYRRYDGWLIQKGWDILKKDDDVKLGKKTLQIKPGNEIVVKALTKTRTI